MAVVALLDRTSAEGLRRGLGLGLGAVEDAGLQVQRRAAAGGRGLHDRPQHGGPRDPAEADALTAPLPESCRAASSARIASRALWRGLAGRERGVRGTRPAASRRPWPPGAP